jgi:hypothetical protein
MKKQLLYILCFLSLIIFLLAACEKDYKPDDTSPPALPPPISFIEEFDTVANLSGKGWVIQNNSDPYGPFAWRQGKFEMGGKLGSEVVGFAAYSAVYNQNEFISVDLNAGKDASLISCWLITPPMPLKNGDEISFYSRSHGDFVDRMQVRANFTSESMNVGNAATDVGDFTTLLLDINEFMADGIYPIVWTKYTLVMSGITTTGIKHRIAFRYYVPNGGPGGANGDMVGIDVFEYKSK